MDKIKELQDKLAQYQQKEKELESRIQELTDFVENAAMPMHSLDKDWRILWANQAELDFLGYSREEYIGHLISEFNPDAENVAEIKNQLSNNSSLHNFPAKLTCKDGTVKHVLINSTVFKKNEEFEHTRCIMSDVTGSVVEEARKGSLLIELEQSEARLRMAIESTRLGTWDFHPLTGVLNWSSECRKIYGIPEGAVVDFQAFAEHIHPDDKDIVEKKIQRSVNSGGDGNYNISYRILRFDDNSIRWIRAQGQVFFNAERQAERFLGTVIDITDLKIAEEKIIRSEKLFRSIALNIPKSLIIVIDKDHRFIFVEGEIMEKMGYLRGDYEGKHPTEIDSPERYEANKHLYDRMLAGETFITERQGSDGRHFMINFVPLKNDSGEVYAGLIIALDIEDIKLAEEKSAKLAAIVQSSDDAIISKTLDGIITSWNISAQRMFGYTAEEIIGQSIMMLIPPDRLDEEPRILSRLRTGERVDHYETKRITKDRKILDVSLSISPVRDSTGKIIGLSKIARDITEKKQEELRKNGFIAMVSHELNTPLTSIKAYIQVLLAKAKEEENTFGINALSRAEIQVRRMSSMIQDFLSLARLEEGKIQLNKEVFKLNPLIDEIVKDAAYLTNSHIVHYEDCGDIQVLADKNKIGQVLTNLLSNAIKYSPNGGDITIACHHHDGKVRVSVTDQGIGISSLDQQRLFDRFYRVENEKLKTVSGFGIGLFLVAEILRFHDSIIEVQSEEGLGSVFSFSLSVAE